MQYNKSKRAIIIIIYIYIYKKEILHSVDFINQTNETKKKMAWGKAEEKKHDIILQKQEPCAQIVYNLCLSVCTDESDENK